MSAYPEIKLSTEEIGGIAAILSDRVQKSFYDAIVSEVMERPGDLPTDWSVSDADIKKIINKLKKIL